MYDENTENGHLMLRKRKKLRGMLIRTMPRFSQRSVTYIISL